MARNQTEKRNYYIALSAALGYVTIQGYIACRTCQGCGMVKPTMQTHLACSKCYGKGYQPHKMHVPGDTLATVVEQEHT